MTYEITQSHVRLDGERVHYNDLRRQFPGAHSGIDALRELAADGNEIAAALLAYIGALESAREGG